MMPPTVMRLGGGYPLVPFQTIYAKVVKLVPFELFTPKQRGFGDRDVCVANLSAISRDELERH